MNQAPVTSTNMSSFAQVGVKTDLHFACCRGDPKLIIEAVKKVISLASSRVLRNLDTLISIPHQNPANTTPFGLSRKKREALCRPIDHVFCTMHFSSTINLLIFRYYIFLSGV